MVIIFGMCGRLSLDDMHVLVFKDTQSWYMVCHSCCCGLLVRHDHLPCSCHSGYWSQQCRFVHELRGVPTQEGSMHVHEKEDWMNRMHIMTIMPKYFRDDLFTERVVGNLSAQVMQDRVLFLGNIVVCAFVHVCDNRLVYICDFLYTHIFCCILNHVSWPGGKNEQMQCQVSFCIFLLFALHLNLHLLYHSISSVLVQYHCTKFIILVETLAGLD